MSDPKSLQFFMETVFYHLYAINKINSDKNIRKAEKDTQTAQIWFSLHTRMKEYFETCLMDKLDYGFRQHEQRLAEQQQQRKQQAAMDSLAFEAFLKDNPDFDSPEITISNVTFTPAEEDSGK